MAVPNAVAIWGSNSMWQWQRSLMLCCWMCQELRGSPCSFALHAILSKSLPRGGHSPQSLTPSNSACPFVYTQMSHISLHIIIVFWHWVLYYTLLPVSWILPMTLILGLHAWAGEHRIRAAREQEKAVPHQLVGCNLSGRTTSNSIELHSDHRVYIVCTQWNYIVIIGCT